jgi:hypothetical protein
MTTVFHKDLTQKKWNKLDIFNQMANIGSEFERAVKWREKSKEESDRALERMLELIDLTIGDPKNKKRLREIVRLREVLADLLVFDNIYQSDIEKTKNYFYAFNWAAQIKKGL